MTENELKEAYNEMRKSGATDNDILGFLYHLYQEHTIDTNQLREMVDILGYEFTEDFENMSEDDKHTKGYEEDYNQIVQSFGNNYRALNKYVMDHTIKMCSEDAEIKQSIADSISNQKIVYSDDELAVEKDGPTKRIIVSKKRSFEAAESYIGKHIAVLNFANNHSIGGSPWSAGAQEESLCRCSSLYPCLKAAEIPFYQKHRDAYSRGELTEWGNDDLIYTPNVEVFKTDESAPRMRDHADRFYVDVITSAAPQLRQIGEYQPLTDCIYKRLKKVFEIAKINKVEVLILGAYGCGAFGNPPKVVCWAFKQLLEEYRFDTVEFAVYCTNYGVDSNYVVFKDHFGGSSRKFDELTKHIKLIDKSAFNIFGSPEDRSEKMVLDFYKEMYAFIDEMYRFMDSHPEYETKDYINTLRNEYGIDISKIDYQLDGDCWRCDGRKLALGLRMGDNLIDADAKLIILLLTCAVRAEHFDTGCFVEFIKNHFVSECLYRLKKIDDDSENN
ncbi:MAG: TIGR02452 family protein [Clostridia bacterium]|nr:TIGR02452 family protein [Clostridia bacterium]